MRWFKVVFVFCVFSLYSQGEKKLALVIGNSNYENELKNPVNDARLIASVLDSLSFDVILKENLETDRDFKEAVNEFGKKRLSYEIGFIYYAGHGIQIDGVNYLLPTKEVFSSEEDVRLYAFDAQTLMRILGKRTDQANILVLDACRDNPYERSWSLTRSSKNSSGLAKMPPPTGSLIAFSTDSGTTAPDGKGKNSIYTLSLAKNLLMKDISIDQVFRNVRAEVLRQGNQQRPSEESKLTGGALILNPSSFDSSYSFVNDVLIGKGEYAYDYVKALEVVNTLLNKNPFDQKSIKLKIETYLCMGRIDKGLKLLNSQIEKFNNDDYLHYLKGFFYQQLALKKFVNYSGVKFEKPDEVAIAQASFAKAISINPESPVYYYALADLYGSVLYQWNTEKMLYYSSLSIEKKAYLKHNTEEGRSYFFEERVREGRSDDGGRFKKTRFSVAWAYNLRIKEYLNSEEYKNLCNEMNAALVYLLENEEEYDNLISRLEQGVDTSLMYLQEAINNGEDFCAKND